MTQLRDYFDENAYDNTRPIMKQKMTDYGNATI